MNQQKKVAVFFGGCSTEYAVSLQSAYAIIKCIDTKKYVPILIGIAPHSGKWYWYQGELEKIKEDNWQSEENCTPVFPSFDRRVVLLGQSSFRDNFIRCCIASFTWKERRRWNNSRGSGFDGDSCYRMWFIIFRFMYG